MTRRSPVDDPSRLPLDRRRFASLLARGAAALAAQGYVSPGLARALAIPDLDLPPWIPDVDGDGVVSDADRKLVRAALATRRGYGLLPAPGYDYRADLYGRGRVGDKDLDAVETVLRAAAPPSSPRPVSVAWHYAWYHKRHRVGQTASFLGGDYLSDDPDTEHVFNRLKNEFGITVDALSWVSPRVEPRVMSNLNRGYFQARSLRTRRVAVLYESTINLGANGARIDFTDDEVRDNLVDDFVRIAGLLQRHERDSGARLFRLDGRPVVFIYGSHTWIADPTSDFEGIYVEDAVARACDRFADVLGQRPFLVGEELPLAPGDEFSRDRKRRAASFDALFRYHHVSSPWNIIHGGNRLNADYARAQQQLLDRNRVTLGELRNRFTGQPLGIVPSLAAGFAKKGMRKLYVSRDSYANYLAEMRAWHERSLQWHRAEVPRWMSAPVVTVGSWNEEFEGHALFPFIENASIPHPKEHGFDLLMALKQNFGWNSLVHRELA